MKAIVYEQYGPPDVLRYSDVDTPRPGDDEVLVRVEASSINFGDRAAMRGEPRVMRLAFGLGRPKVTVLGRDIAGTVKAVGSRVTRFRPGDRVAGEVNQRGFAEFAVAKEAGLAPIPDGVPAQVAGTVPIAGGTAWRALRLAGPDAQRILVNGASGGVGMFLVQLAKAKGLHVTGVCSTRNVEFVRGLGADEVVDYTRQDFTASDETFDAIIDLAGNHPLGKVRRVLAPRGVYIASFGYGGRVLGPLPKMLKVLLAAPWTGQKLRVLGPNGSAEELSEVLALVAAGSVRVKVDWSYPLSAAADAMRDLEAAHAQGKVVLEMI